jgi:hypothetical protein
MRRVMALLAGLAILLMSGAVFGQAEDSEEKSKFYDFDEMNLKGERVMPPGSDFTSKEEARFERLSDLKGEKELMLKVHETTDDAALK